MRTIPFTNYCQYIKTSQNDFTVDCSRWKGTLSSPTCGDMKFQVALHAEFKSRQTCFLPRAPSNLVKCLGSSKNVTYLCLLALFVWLQLLKIFLIIFHVCLLFDEDFESEIFWSSHLRISQNVFSSCLCICIRKVTSAWLWQRLWSRCHWQPSICYMKQEIDK